jgi:prepilin-type N-terminal cleavage/methylation domain-containing protein
MREDNRQDTREQANSAAGEKRRFARSAGRAGFTLIELLIVVVIIGILASIAIPKFTAVREKAFRAAMMSDLKNLASQQEVYHNDHYTYASSLTAAQAISSEGVTVIINEATGTGWSATAVHVGLGSEQCGIYHGNAAASGGSPATAVGIVTCSF